MSIIYLKRKAGSFVPSDATRVAIEAAFVRLGQTHGCYEVATVAAYLLAQAIETVREKRSPNADAWVADLKACLDQAFKGG